MPKLNLLTLGNPKIEKGRARGYLTAVLHLHPYILDGKNSCPFATPGCAAGCLNRAGRGGIFRAGEITNAIQDARARRTRELRADPGAFVARVSADIVKLQRFAREKRKRLAIRLNGTSDIVWEVIAPEIFDAFPRVQFYDYTKIPARVSPGWKLPANYRLTFSRSERNETDALRVLENGGNVAAVFRKDLPASWQGFPVINADADDLRFLDPSGSIAGLKAKGPAKRDTSGFVIR
jgi:hypothetical protein